MPDVVIYLTPACPYCTRARQLLDRKGVNYALIDVSGSNRLWSEMTRLSQRDTVPQIFIDDRHIGGYDNMVALDMDGELDKLLGLD